MVGAGGLASVLCRSLVRLGMRLDVVAVRSLDSGKKLVAENKMGQAVSLIEWAQPVSSLVLLCVPDDAVEDVATEMASRGTWKGRTVLHTSGVHNKSVLRSLADQGASVGSFHPLQSFLGSESQQTFRGITIGVEGDPGAVQIGKELCNVLLAESLEIPSGAKPAYHAAAALASNAAVTLLSVAEEIWVASVGSSVNFGAALGPLIMQSVTNALEKGPSEALTGPISRGDVGTVTAHFKSIAATAPHFLALYGSMATETVHLAMRSGRLTAEQAVALLDVISENIAVSDSSDELP